MVDADIHNPQLGRRLGLAAQVGWDAVVSGELALTEVLIDSLDDRLTLLPLCSQSRFDGSPSISQFSMMLSILRDHYDVVLVDMGPLLEGMQGGLHLIEQNSGIDAGVLVADMRSHAPDGLRQAQRLLAAAQIRCTGIAENFVQV
jgi:Mrp family chromosome partitioning ATPase